MSQLAPLCGSLGWDNRRIKQQTSLRNSIDRRGKRECVRAWWYPFDEAVEGGATAPLSPRAIRLELILFARDFPVIYIPVKRLFSLKKGMVIIPSL